jgi:hypothetical protein
MKLGPPHPSLRHGGCGWVGGGSLLIMPGKPAATVKSVLIRSLVGAMLLGLLWRFLWKHSTGDAIVFGLVFGAVLCLLLPAVREQQQRQLRP